MRLKVAIFFLLAIRRELPRLTLRLEVGASCFKKRKYHAIMKPSSCYFLSRSNAIGILTLRIKIPYAPYGVLGGIIHAKKR